MTATTGGRNFLVVLRDDYGVAIDPHSHENGGYNYADVAWLLDDLGVGGRPSSAATSGTRRCRSSRDGIASASRSPANASPTTWPAISSSAAAPRTTSTTRS